MKVAILQFSARLGEVEANIEHADTLLSKCMANIDLLVLPEMAFTGYNFPSLAAITPYLEPTANGRSTHWAIKTARERQCHVIVGYPETTTTTTTTTTQPTPVNYNSTVTISPEGHILATYRKSFLYYTDETWATEGFLSPPSSKNTPPIPPKPPFHASLLPTLTGAGEGPSPIVVGHGICMDINPQRFVAPWTLYEFATSMLTHQCKLVIVCMAWLTRLTPEETALSPSIPDMETLAYWLERFFPFVDARPTEAIVVVLANRCGSEGRFISPAAGGGNHGEMMIDEMGDRVAYAGSSCVMRFQGGSVKLWERLEGSRKGEMGLLGKGEEGVLVVDTGVPAGFLLQGMVGGGG